MRSKLTIDESVRFILERLAGNGHEAYIVGGAVRDLMLGRHPKDFDIATSATPAQIKDSFGRAAQIIGRRFRLAHVRVGRVCYEVSTFRREPTAEERTSRESDDGVMIWRDNQYGTLEQDALRRDFTVNALYYSPLTDPQFRDFCDGEDDLRNKVVRAIGDPDMRLAEDPVRIIRAVKLMAEYDFKPAHNLVGPLKARAGMLAHCSVARLFEELLKIFQKPYAMKTFDTMDKYGVLSPILPVMARSWNGKSGKAGREILAIRDARLAKGNYSNSRALALATAVFAYAGETTDTPAGEIWEYRPGLEKDLRDAVLDFYSPLPVPRVLATRARDLLLLLPRFRNSRGRGKMLAHPEYRYARELYSILTELFGWDMEFIEQWPVLGTGHPHRSHSQHGGGPRRRSPRPRRDS